MTVHIVGRIATRRRAKLREFQKGQCRMIYATRIKMMPGCWNSQYSTEIHSIYLDANEWSGYYEKEVVYEFLKKHPDSIAVNISPYPHLVPMVSVNREKYVRSSPDIYKHDDLLDLPRDW